MEHRMKERDAAGRGLVTALLWKHVLIAAGLVAGIVVWITTERRANKLRKGNNE